MDEPQALLEKYKELVPLILLGLAQVQQTKEAAAEESIPPVPTAPTPEPEPTPVPIPLETPAELPAAAAAPAPEPEPDVSKLVAALQQYMQTTAAPAITPAAVAPVVPKTIRDVDALLKNNPLVLK